MLLHVDSCTGVCFSQLTSLIMAVFNLQRILIIEIKMNSKIPYGCKLYRCRILIIFEANYFFLYLFIPRLETYI